MFIRKKFIKGHEYWYLVKNTWQGGKSRQKVVKYLGKYGSFDMDSVMKLIELNKGAKEGKENRGVQAAEGTGQ